MEGTEDEKSNSKFTRLSPTRNTIVSKCRKFFECRLKQADKFRSNTFSGTTTADSQEDLTCVGTAGDTNGNATTVANASFAETRKWKSSMDLQMDNLRREISSLITQDNDLFRQLLSLHDSISELRERQEMSMDGYYDSSSDDEIEDPLEGGDPHHIHHLHHHHHQKEKDPDAVSNQTSSLGSMSDTDNTVSPESTLSSNSSHYYRKRHYQKNTNGSANLSPTYRTRGSSDTTVVSGKTCRFHHGSARGKVGCWRCLHGGKTAPPVCRRSFSYSSLYWRKEDMQSCDSGIHLQGTHSDSDHEIFV